MAKYIINGGGMVGASAALALAQQGHTVNLIDAQPLPTNCEDWDLRISSVNDNHWRWLLELGVGAHLNPQKWRPYEQLSVTTIGGDELSFSATDVQQSQLGVMVENNSLQKALWACLDALPQVQCFASATIQRIDFQQQHVTVNEQTLDYDYLIGADGANSRVAREAGIGYRGWDYDQRCLLATVKLTQPVSSATWEVFRGCGPYALLPLTEHFACLIDYRSRQEIREISSDKGRLKQALAAQFSERIGEFELCRFASFPLQRKTALSYHAGNSVLLMGDAAHSIHPLAGQGVNLGFADVRAWLKAADASDYQQMRRRQNGLMMRAMDAIHMGFRQPNPLVQLGLKAAFTVLKSDTLKRRIIRQAMQWESSE